MSRGGIVPTQTVDAARRLLDAGLPRLAGTWSHLASPEDAAAVGAQVERFEAALDALRGAGIDPGMRHLNATGGLLAGAGPAYDLVRVGLAFYGVLPPEVAVAPAHAGREALLRPAIALRARAATISAVPAGSSVGYGGTWTAARPSVVATLPVGYADGWARAYAGGSWGIARGLRVPVIGRVSSDALAVDVTDVPEFGPGDEVTLLGVPPAMTVHDLAALRGSIAWEVLDAFVARLSRVFVEGGAPVGVRYLDGRTRLGPRPPA
jgi:alanine racemase